MNRAVLVLACGLALARAAFSQTAADPDNFVRLEQIGPGFYEISSYGRSGRAYFLQYSEDLIAWTYIPGIIETGVGTPITIGISDSDIPESGRFFLRVKYCFLTAADPFAADFDNDRVNNTSTCKKLPGADHSVFGFRSGFKSNPNIVKNCSSTKLYENYPSTNSSLPFATILALFWSLARSLREPSRRKRNTPSHRSPIPPRPAATLALPRLPL